jgi:hypothetical protein
LKGSRKAARKTFVRAGESVGVAGRGSKDIFFSLFFCCVFICIFYTELWIYGFDKMKTR